jgi:hypothetical protein
MKDNVVGYIPRLMFKFYLYLKNKFDPKPPITEEEKFCIEITKELINRENSVLTLAPLSQKRFIKNDELNMFIMMMITTYKFDIIYQVTWYEDYNKYNIYDEE